MKKRVIITMLLFCAAWQVAFAMLNIELTQGVTRAIPVALLPLPDDHQLADGQLLTSVMRANLENCGRFKVVTIPANQHTPQSLADINFTFWRKQGVDNLIFTKVAVDNAKQLTLDFTILDLFDNNKILVHKIIKATEHDWRGLAHYLSDIVYQKLTGDPGFFATRIAYIKANHHPSRMQSRYTLEVADSDGHNPHALLVSSQPIMSPAWSPDGQKIAYVSFENQRAEVYVVDIKSGQRELISQYAGINGSPSWSPDGKSLALVLSKTGVAKLYLADVATKKIQPLTFGSAIDTEPEFTPDGKQLIFTSDRGGSPQIYRLNLQDKTVERLTFTGSYNAVGRVTPDGRLLVMLHRNAGMYNIAVQDLQNGDFRLLTQEGFAESPSIAPNGKMIIYATRYAGRRVLSVVSLDGQVKLRVPSGNGEVQEPAWGPSLHS